MSGKVHLKHYFYTFKMDLSRDLEQNLDDFKILITQVDDIDHKVEDET